MSPRGKRASSRAPRIEPVDDELPDDSEDGTEPGFDDLDAMLEEIGGEAEYVVLWRVDGPGKPEHVDKVAFSRFNIEYVTQRHGGGDYKLRAYGPIRAGYPGRSAVRRGYREFSIDKSLPPLSGSAGLLWKQKHPEMNPGGAVAVTPVVPPSSGLPDWAKELMVASVPLLVGGVVAWMGKEKTTDPLLAELVRASANRPAATGTDPVALQQLLADERDRAIELGKEIGRKGGSAIEEDPTMLAVSKGLDTLQTFAEGWRAKTQAEAGQASQRPDDRSAQSLPAGTVDHAGGTLGDTAHARALVPGSGVAASAGDGGAMTPALIPIDGERRWVAVVRPHAPMLAAMAGTLHPVTAAHMIGDVLDDDAFADLVADIEEGPTGSILVRLVRYFPSLATVPVAWVQELLNNIVAQVDAPGDESDGSVAEGTGGTGGNHSGDASASAGTSQRSGDSSVDTDTPRR